MTPKDKAEELVRKMCFNDCTIKNIDKAKQCALIAIDEMIKTSEEAMLFKQSKRDWLQEVKQEIEKI